MIFVLVSNLALLKILDYYEVELNTYIHTYIYIYIYIYAITK